MKRYCVIVVQCFPDVERQRGECSPPCRDAAEITFDIQTEWTSPSLSILSGQSCGSNSEAGYMAAYHQHLSVSCNGELTAGFFLAPNEVELVAF